MHWYELHNINTIDTPAVLVYPERMRENILLLKKTVGDVQRLRPHIKTSKMVEAVQLLQAEGINKFKCATIAEAEMLGLAGAADVLLAYQPVGPKIDRLLQVVEQYPDTKYACLVDNSASAITIAAVFAAAQRTLPVYLDLNIGMNRTGIEPGPYDDVRDLYLELQQIPGIKAVGLHAYDGHLHDTTFELRREKCNAGFAPVLALAAAIADAGTPAPLIVAGGTPTYEIYAEHAGVECSPGTFIFQDWGYKEQHPEQLFDFAAVVITRVISVIDGKHVCVDLGHKSVASENPQPRIHFLNAPDAEPQGHSEEHLVVKVPDTASYPVGTVLYGIPTHICPTVALYERAGVVENNNCVAWWKVVARDRKIMI
ncbi:D-TA family PLP-dependent enzyme [Chitinophaga rhizophila]|uniref:D-TA family PLP-dependent enzyme n=1 Tax=Chitinophaga rhizophila TaxID=2866212 RepID=A0ABS7GCV4_9BACT|nr:D-TA family PLP-dependent enzyme [Chitinophaga rhizophila]MBW8685503.1 D-TA family PLP-dependent enzyme [Chitinophaga rhizophila]